MATATFIFVSDYATLTFFRDEVDATLDRQQIIATYEKSVMEELGETALNPDSFHLDEVEVY